MAVVRGPFWFFRGDTNAIRLRLQEYHQRVRESERTRLTAGFLRKSRADALDFDFTLLRVIATIFLIVIFFVFIINPLNTSEVVYATKSLIENLPDQEETPRSWIPATANKTNHYTAFRFADVSSEFDWYDFLEYAVVPTVFSEKYQKSTETARLLDEFVPLSFLDISAFHVTAGAGSCEKVPDSRYGPGYPKLCFPTYSVDDDLRSSQLRHYFNVSTGDSCKGSYYFGHHVLRYGCRRYSVKIPFNHTREEVAAITQEIRNRRFGYSPTARLLAISFYAYHPELRAVFEVSMTAEVTEVGGIKPWRRIIPVLVNEPLQNIVAIAIIAGVSYVGLAALRFFVKLIACHGSVRGAKDAYLAERWEVIADILSIFSCTVLGLYVAASNLRNVDRAKTYVDDWLSGRGTVDISIPTDLVFSDRIKGIMLAATVLLLFFRMLTLSRIHHQVNTITETLAAATNKTASLLVLFMLVVLSFAVFGTVLYGPYLYTWRGVHSGINALLNLILGDFDFEAMRKISAAATLLYILFFVLASQFVLLNFIIAILTNTLKDKASEYEPFTISEFLTLRYNMFLDTVLEVRTYAAYRASLSPFRSKAHDIVGALHLQEDDYVVTFADVLAIASLGLDQPNLSDEAKAAIENRMRRDWYSYCVYYGRTQESADLSAASDRDIAWTKAVGQRVREHWTAFLGRTGVSPSPAASHSEPPTTTAAGAATVSDSKMADISEAERLTETMMKSLNALNADLLRVCGSDHYLVPEGMRQQAQRRGGSRRPTALPNALRSQSQSHEPVEN